eukprot:g3436.t1
MCLINITWAALSFSVALICTGIALLLNETLYDAYGNQLISHWEGLVLTGIIIAVPGLCCSNYAIKRHNKFWLLMYGVLLFSLLAYHSYLALFIAGYAKLDYSYDEIEECLSYVPPDESYNMSDTCLEYYRNENTESIYKLWVSRFIRSKEQDTDMLTWGVSLQRAGDCCGFNKPGVCNQDRTMPTDIFSDYISPTLHFQFYTPHAFRGENNETFLGWSHCGAKPDWYPATSGELECAKDLRDNPDQPYYMGGCPYDLPIGGCDAVEGKKGCSWYIAIQLVETLEMFWTAMIVYISVDLLLILLILVYFLKRKDAEVLPINMRKWKPEPCDPEVAMEAALGGGMDMPSE